MPPVPSLVTSSGGPAELAEAARLAEAAGFESVWATEFYDRSATVALAAMAQATAEIELGSAIAYGFGRTPVVLAAEARDLDELSGGRLTLGLGTGTKRMQRDWHGLDGERPAARMEELVPLLRRLWRLHEGPVEHEGRLPTRRARSEAAMNRTAMAAVAITCGRLSADHEMDMAASAIAGAMPITAGNSRARKL